MTWSFPQFIHRLCTSIPRAAHMPSRGCQQLSHKFAHNPTGGEPRIHRCSGQPGEQLGIGVWTTGDSCGRSERGQKLSTTRLSQSPDTSRGHPHGMARHDQPKQDLSPQLTALTTTALISLLFRKKTRERGAVDKWTTSPRSSPGGLANARTRMRRSASTLYGGTPAKTASANIAPAIAVEACPPRCVRRGTLRRDAEHTEPSSRARLDKFSAAKPRLKPKGHP